MKNKAIYIFAALLTLVACKKTGKAPEYAEGYLSIANMDITVDEELITKAPAEVGGNYIITVLDTEGRVVVTKSYADIKTDGGKVTLREGNYTISACSAAEVPAAAFEQPVYGASAQVEIKAGETTEAGSMVCTLLQTKVTVDYSDEFLLDVTGDGATTVTVTSGFPLEYALSYNGGKPSYNKNAGYFVVNNGASTTMEVSFKGSIEGKTQKMTKVITGIEPRSWHQIKFLKKTSDKGTAEFFISIDGFVEDEPLTNDIAGSELTIGEDPDAPTGDGGIELVSTCDYDITKPIEVPVMGESFVLTMQAKVPGKVKKFTVVIDSDNADFVNSVKAINDGQSELDLINPSDGAISVFTNILPFPYGDGVYNKEVIDFNLSDAQEPLLAFSGSHQFVLKCVDQNGCKKDITIVLVVK